MKAAQQICYDTQVIILRDALMHIISLYNKTWSHAKTFRIIILG